jgi:lariat debranching enzyme
LMVWLGVAGCVHGRLDFLYEQFIEETHTRGIQCKLLLCCGDFQSIRDEEDLKSMSCPRQYRELGDFPKYYSGEKTAPCLTIFIGGNHEASRYLQEIPLGGWVAPRIFYLGRAGILRNARHDYRIGGISGIYYPKDYFRPRDEGVLLHGSQIHTVYHTRKTEWRLLLHALHWNAFDGGSFSPETDIASRDRCHVFLSHDWPRGVMAYGDCSTLWTRKQWMQRAHQRGIDGSPALAELMESSAAPRYWFAAHHHCRFAASTPQGTSFTALDQTLPGCPFLTFVELPGGESADPVSEMEYDLRWLRCVQRHYRGEREPSGSISLAALQRVFESTRQKRASETPAPGYGNETAPNPQTSFLLGELGISWERLHNVDGVQANPQ